MYDTPASGAGKRHRAASLPRSLWAASLAVFLVAGQAAVRAEDSLKDGAKKAGHSIGSVAREIGKGAKTAGKEVGQAAKEGGREFRRALKGQGDK